MTRVTVISLLLLGLVTGGMTPVSGDTTDADPAGHWTLNLDDWTGQDARTWGTRIVDLDGNVHRIGMLEAPGPAILVFINSWCPVSRRYTVELNRLHEAALAHDIAFYGVISDPLSTAAQAREFAEAYEIGFPVLFDGSGDLARRLDPVVTPEVFVVSVHDDVLYRGRIDNRFESIGVLRNQITSHDLAGVISNIASGSVELPTRTTPVGCVFEAWKEPVPETVTWHRDIAPLLTANCVECHRNDGVAPFALDTYQHASARAQMLSLVTSAEIMPPWRAVEGFGLFRDERHLSERQKDLFSAWADAGTPLGNPDDSIPAVQWPERDWQTGEPDMVVEMIEPYAVSAGGPDIYRYFVIPFELLRERAVSAIEFLPGDPSVVHHANLFVDYSGRARRQDAQDDEPGFSVFGTGDFFDYSGEGEAWGIGGWTPGVDPYVLPEGYAMWLPVGGGDIVFEIHYHPSGKATVDQSRMAFYFTDKPVRHWVDGMVIGTQNLVIPADSDDYWRHITMDVPVDVTLVDILPHMHFLGAEAKAVATLPDGSHVPLVHVKNWDLRWQNIFFFREPLFLPAGSRIDGWVRFDNTALNPYNPSSPPKTVGWGWGSDEEMAEFWISFVLDDPSKREQFISASWSSWYGTATLTEPVPDLEDLEIR